MSETRKARQLDCLKVLDVYRHQYFFISSRRRPGFVTVGTQRREIERETVGF